ncbi:MAG: TIGR04552 family protein [Myxococcota bacterium]
MTGTTIDTSIQKLLDGGLNLSDLDALGLILGGGSVVDWYRLNFKTLEEVDAFLLLHRHDWADPFDRRRLLGLYLDAVEYLAENFDYRLPPEIAAVDDVRTVFLNASSGTADARLQMLSCVVLKVMHIIHHAQARELLYITPVSYRQIFGAVEEKVGREVVAMQREGYPIHSFTGTRKTMHNQVTRLLAAREVIAARVYDKVSFQIVTERVEDILPVLLHLARRVFPFNYVVPGAGSNSLIDLAAIVRSVPGLKGDMDLLQSVEARAGAAADASQGPTPKAVDFVVDMPLRVDELGIQTGTETQERLGRIVFALVEFQLQDLATFRLNETSDAGRSAQRRRMKARAWDRLTKGRLE